MKRSVSKPAKNTAGLRPSVELTTELPYQALSSPNLCDMCPIFSLYILKEVCIACQSIYGLQIAERAPHTKLKLNCTYRCLVHNELGRVS